MSQEQDRPPEAAAGATAAGSKAAADKAAAARRLAEQASLDQAAAAEREAQQRAAQYSANHAEPAPADAAPCECSARIDAIQEQVSMLGKIVLAGVAAAAIVWFLRGSSDREPAAIEQT